MKRLLLLILIIVVISTLGAVPNVVYGAEEKDAPGLSDEDLRLLTPEEKAFLSALGDKYGRLHRSLLDLNDTADDILSTRFSKRDDLIKERNWWLAHPPDCSIQNSPAIFEDIRTEWNTQVCQVYVTLHGNIVSSFEDALANPNLTDATFFTSGVIPLLSSRLDDLMFEGKPLREKAEEVILRANGRTEELIELRKEAREKAKPVLERIRDLLKGTGSEAEKDKDSEDKPEADSDKERGKANPISELIEDLLKGTGSEAEKDKDSEDKPEADKDEKDGEEDCFIATAAYGSPTAREIDILRQFRDEFLVHNYPGRTFVDFYYTTSPPIASFISEHEMLRVAVREGFVDPIVAVVEFTESWWAE
ncbi:MAG: hypothetical protein JSV54_07775 [Chloroflexota bacterium]|nr:MAG: hypothetical protein JSV54_07775 [Chloroflexota bacterium]